MHRTIALTHPRAVEPLRWSYGAVIKRAAELIEVTKFTPKQLAAKKSIEQARMAQIVGEEAAIWCNTVVIAKEMSANGASIEFIAKCLKQSIEETQDRIDLTDENDRKPFF